MHSTAETEARQSQRKTGSLYDRSQSSGSKIDTRRGGECEIHNLTDVDVRGPNELVTGDDLVWAVYRHVSMCELSVKS